MYLLNMEDLAPKLKNTNLSQFRPTNLGKCGDLTKE